MSAVSEDANGTVPVVQRSWVRVGGAFGLVGALAMISAYVVGTPDSPETPAGVADYYDDVDAFVVANGVVPLLHVLGFLVFLAVLVAIVRHADHDGEAPVLHRVVLAGGVVFITLSAAGFAAEVAYPAMISRFDAEPSEALGQLMLSLATWLYHFCQIGAAVMVGAASVTAWRTRVLPSWMAAVGAVVVVLTLLHTWIPLVAALSSLVWIGVVSLLMMSGAIAIDRPSIGPAARRGTQA